MHSYSSDCPSRKYVPFGLAVVSILFAWGMSLAIAYLKIKSPWWVDIPSVMGFYGLGHELFERYIWRFKLVRILRIVRTPDIKGVWKGHLKSSFDDFKSQKDIQIIIKQNWTHLSIDAETKESKSSSLIGAVLINDREKSELIYEYFNEPKVIAKETMHSHRGTCHLVLKNDKLEGEFYSGRDRKNIGQICVQKKEIN